MKSLLRPLVAMTVGFSSALVVTAAPAQPTGVQSIVRDGQKDFDWELGTWTTKVRVRTNPLSGEAPTWVEFQGTSVIKPVSGGRANLVELSVAGPKIPANFSNTEKKPKYSDDFSFGIMRANNDRLNA